MEAVNRQQLYAGKSQELLLSSDSVSFLEELQ